MTISKTYLQKDSNSLNAAEQRFDVMPCGAGLSAPKTSLNKLCYNQMRDIAKKRTNHLPSGQMEQTLRAYRDYAVGYAMYAGNPAVCKKTDINWVPEAYDLAMAQLESQQE